MAFASGKFPPVRLSDIDGLVPENVLDSSSGNKLIEYIRNQDGKSRRPRLNVLFDDDDNQVRFEFDKIQVPVSPKSPAVVSPESARASDATVDEVVATEPPAVSQAVITVVQNENRVPSFLSPRRNTDTGQQGVRSPSTTAASPGRGSPFRSRVQSSKLDLNRLALLKECQRVNDLKFEKLRQIASSTPITGHNQQERIGKSFMSLSKSISPIPELNSPELDAPDRQPTELGALSSPQRRSPVPASLQLPCPAPVAPAPVAPAAPERHSAVSPSSPQRRISCLVPATQDQADGIPSQQNDVLSSPPRAEQMVVIPETPSPVHRNHQPISTPLSGLRLFRRSSSPRSAVRRTLMKEERDDVFSTPRRSILKRESETGSDSSIKHVSFAEQLYEVRHVSPAYICSPHNSDITSDESEEEEQHDEAAVVFKSIATKETRKPLDKVQPAKSNVQAAVEVRSQPAIGELQKKTSDHEEESRENMVQSPDPRPCIEPNDNRRLHDRIEAHGNAEARESPIALTVERSDKDDAERPISRSFGTARAGNRTNRNTINMIMEDWDSEDIPSTNDTQHLVTEQRVQRSTSPNTEPIPITNIDTPRPILHEILDPPSAFCDETDANSASDVEEPANGKSDRNNMPPTDDGESSSGVSSDGSSTVEARTMEAEHDGAIASVPYNSAIRIKSVNSPHDHISMNMLAAVDEIHRSQSSQVAKGVETNRPSQGDRRTLVLTRKRSTLAAVNPDAVSYFKAIEKTCAPKRSKKVKSGKERRKLFIKEMAVDDLGDGKDEEPNELVPSPELEPPEQAPEREQEPVPRAIESVSSSAITCPLVAVRLQRLSNGTIERMIGVKQTLSTCINPPVEPEPPMILLASPPPVTEKQNVESPEKACMPSQPKRTKTAKAEPWKKMVRSDETRQLKQLKDVANEIRQQVEGTNSDDGPLFPEEGVRRSHRNRRLAKDVLKRNPIMMHNDVPNYREPTVKDVLRFYREAEMATGKTAKKPKAPRAPRKTAKTATTERQQPVQEGQVQKRGRKPKQKQKPVNEIDKEGFRIPLPPSSPSSVASSSPKSEKERPQPPSSSTLLSHMGSSPNGFSLDSGLSSATCVSHTGDETDNHPRADKNAPRKQDTALPSTSKTTQCSNVSLQEGSTAADIVAERRRVLDWMMFLTESQKDRPTNTPAPEKPGFRHFSVEHLMFDRSGDIEYSFYSFSVTDNFGFIRMLPNAKKKTSRAKGCVLRFLILNGTAVFTINGIEAKAVGGDFFVLPAGTRYQIQNTSETSLMFMMKSAVAAE